MAEAENSGKAIAEAVASSSRAGLQAEAENSGKSIAEAVASSSRAGLQAEAENSGKAIAEAVASSSRAGLQIEAEGKAKAAKAKAVSSSSRAGLQFPVRRVHRHLRENNLMINKRVSITAAAYCAAALEYLTREIMELAGYHCWRSSRKRIQPRHINLAIREDEELDKLVSATIPGGGVQPHIHVELLPKEGRKEPLKKRT